MKTWRLEFEAGGDYALRPGVTVVGRSAACDIVLDDPAVSRRQLLLHVRAEGVELVKLGRRATRCGGVEFEGEHLAKAGELVEIGGRAFAWLRALPQRKWRARWLLRLDGGPAIGMRKTPFTIGSGPSDDLRVADWPPSALRLHDAERALIAELAAPKLLRAGQQAGFDAEGLVRMAPEQGLELGGRRLEIVATATQLERSTRLDDGPVELSLERYERGGALHLGRGGERRSVYLAPRRFALVRALISPRPPTTPGELVGVGELCRAIWPEDAAKDETDFNVLLYRVRRALLQAGFDVDELICRERGTGMLRAPLAAVASVRVD
ncbi:FHA domain-containing protein [Pseudenhygromyxa sp. WMMC2535]|uniref:FHA domain-containing protein n=1 Tax=Pseudenhygromyxa sp. WMMC2535 TaxID=2712867 RepID=UPI0015559D50|nr:FHA domain-containing protein [Pseudenhygromyxa sp. WMMC2535]